MKIATQLLLCIFMLLQFFVGLSVEFHISQLWSNDKPDLLKPRREPNVQIVSLKKVKEKFVTGNSAEDYIDTYNMKYDMTAQTPIKEDPNCEAGFKRDRRGICREVW
ncbi:uncharacterized protein LOC129907032 [Episyrphus balteatus]|uniref:uncharacterized protein LOC129907032 n=1 Tax=Episyrphus balteatus TaxID=286459 RepID=UPI00248684B7|nr:uncharacterized protein LOC129907032 [Episyrphus balteatus]